MFTELRFLLQIAISSRKKLQTVCK